MSIAGMLFGLGLILAGTNCALVAITLKLGEIAVEISKRPQ